MKVRSLCLTGENIFRDVHVIWRIIRWIDDSSLIDSDDRVVGKQLPDCRRMFWHGPRNVIESGRSYVGVITVNRCFSHGSTPAQINLLPICTLAAQVILHLGFSKANRIRSHPVSLISTSHSPIPTTPNPSFSSAI
jgi:hypothetical protein